MFVPVSCIKQLFAYSHESADTNIVIYTSYQKSISTVTVSPFGKLGPSCLHTVVRCGYNCIGVCTDMLKNVLTNSCSKDTELTAYLVS